MPQLLVEVCRKGDPVLLESKSTRPGCLGRFQLICCDYANDTENGRFYSERLWERASAEGSKMAQRIRNKICFGELDHPADRLDSHLTCSAVNLVEFVKNPEDKTYVGTFDILDTPYGRMVRTYLDYGSKIGVSSRGAGDLVVKEGRQCVDEDTYDWEAFDVVLDPAVAKSKAKVLESKQQVGLGKSLLDIVSESTDPYELNLMKKLIENTDVPERDSIIESIENKLSSNDSDGGATLSKLIEDLEDATGKVGELESKNAELIKDASASATRVSVLERTVSSLKTANLKLRSESTKSDRLHKESVRKLNEQLRRAKSALEVRDDQISRLQSDNSIMESTVRSLRSQLSESHRNLEESNRELSDSKKVLSKSRAVITESQSSAKRLESDLEESKRYLKSYKDELSNKDATITQMRESNASVISSYIRRVAEIYSIDEKELANKVKLDGKFLPESIDSIAESMRDQSDRLNRLSFDITKGTLVTESVTTQVSDPEMKRAAEFAKNLSKRN